MTTTDRELLQRAAKAHGFIDDQTSNDEDSHGLRRNGQGIFYVVHKRGWHNWNPLHDDGDALRLANACGLSIEPYPYYDTPKHSVIVKQRRRSDQLRQSNPTEVVEAYGEDKDAATRRAIVRAAAAMAGEGE